MPYFRSVVHLNICLNFIIFHWLKIVRIYLFSGWKNRSGLLPHLLTILKSNCRHPSSARSKSLARNVVAFLPDLVPRMMTSEWGGIAHESPTLNMLVGINLYYTVAWGKCHAVIHTYEICLKFCMAPNSVAKKCNVVLSVQSSTYIKRWDLICGMATLITCRSLCPVLARGRDASTRNLSNSSRPIPLFLCLMSILNCQLY